MRPRARPSAFPGPGLIEVLDATLKATWYSPRKQGLEREVQFVVEDVTLNRLLSLAASPTIGSQAKAISISEIAGLKKWLATESAQASSDRDLAAHLAAGLDEIGRFERAPAQFQQSNEIAAPPGAPIGGN